MTTSGPPTPTSLPIRPDDLPEFGSPPIVEVALTAGSPPQMALRQAHLGVIWGAFREDYPVVQDHVPLEPLSAPGQSVFTFSITSAPPLHRAWFLSAVGDKLIQIQPDRFVANWRITPDREYPMFDELFGAFTTAHGIFVGAVADLGLPQPAVNGVEIVYVNWIDADDPGSFYRPASNWRPEEDGLVMCSRIIEASSRSRSSTLGMAMARCRRS